MGWIFIFLASVRVVLTSWRVSTQTENFEFWVHFGAWGLRGYGQCVGATRKVLLSVGCERDQGAEIILRGAFEGRGELSRQKGRKEENFPPHFLVANHPFDPTGGHVMSKSSDLNLQNI